VSLATPRVLLVVNSYPTDERPDRGVFNRRAAVGLAARLNVGVLFLRTWRPGRNVVTRRREQAWPVIELALPMVPRPGWSVASSRLSATPWIRAILGEWDVLHSVALDFPGILSAHWAWGHGLPHLAQAIGTDLNESLPRCAGHPGLGSWRRGMDLILCNSLGLQEEARRLVPGVPTRVAYRGTDLGRFCADGLDRDPARLRFLYLGGLPLSPNLHVGRDAKGGATLMEAWSRVEGAAASAGARLAFGGPYSDSPVSRSWREGLRHPETVELLGQVAPAEVPRLMRESAVVLLPSRAEGLPNVAVEASASGCAVLGSRVGGVPEVVEDGVTGRLLPPADPAAWALAMGDCIKNPSRLAEMGRAGRRRAEEFFDARRYPDALLELYQEVLGRHRAGRGARPS